VSNDCQQTSTSAHPQQLHVAGSRPYYWTLTWDHTARQPKEHRFRFVPGLRHVHEYGPLARIYVLGSLLPKDQGGNRISNRQCARYDRPLIRRTGFHISPRYLVLGSRNCEEFSLPAGRKQSRNIWLGDDDRPTVPRHGILGWTLNACLRRAGYSLNRPTQPFDPAGLNEAVKCAC